MPFQDTYRKPERTEYSESYLLVNQLFLTLGNTFFEFSLSSVLQIKKVGNFCIYTEDFKS